MLTDIIKLGVTGTNGSGKDGVANYLKTKEFSQYSLSDYLRRELGKSEERTPNEVRKELKELGDKLEEQEPGFLARRAIESIDSKKRICITSIRRGSEVEVLRKSDDFYLIWIDAPSEDRYKRVLLRGDKKKLEQFREEDEMEMQRLELCKSMADFTVFNPGVGQDSLKRLYSEVDRVLERIQKMRDSRERW
jgi:dephospho-CoA kinase